MNKRKLIAWPEKKKKKQLPKLKLQESLRKKRLLALQLNRKQSRRDWSRKSASVKRKRPKKLKDRDSSKKRPKNSGKLKKLLKPRLKNKSGCVWKRNL